MPPADAPGATTGETLAGAAAGAGIRVRDLTWRPYGRARPVLRDLDLDVAPGERVLLAGPSGSGKSTLLRAVAGLLHTADAGDLSGAVTVGELAPQSIPGAVGLVLQDPGAGRVASSIGRDVAFGLENVGCPAADMPARVAAVLAEVGLTMPPESSPDTLSGGESQRLALAGALAMEPSVLLLDEPTAMLDATTAAQVRRVVDGVATRRGLTLVVVEHRLDGWVDLVDRLVVIDDDGQVVADGPPGEVLEQHADSLARQGIWVPGLPEPEPLRVDLPPVGSRAAGGVVAGGVVAGGASVGEVVVRARGLRVEHRSRRLGEPSRTTLAVDGTDLVARSGRALALVGPSGAGKSTLLTALGGLREPTAGRVSLTVPHEATVDGPPHRWTSPEVARAVAWVPQRASTAMLGRTVRGDVLTTPDALGLDPAMAAARADALLAALGLQHLADADPRHLSGGEQRRLAMASAVAHAPALLLADEPTVGQDRRTWAAVTGLLAAAREEGAAVVVATHDAGVVASADDVLAVTAPAGIPTTPTTPPEQARRPLVARAGPLALLAAALCVLPLPALLDTWRQGLVVLGVEVVLALLALLAPGAGPAPQGRIRGVAARLVPAVVAVAGVAWSAWLLGGRDLEVAAGAALRVLCLLVPSAVVVGHLDPEALGDHLAQRLHLPARPVVAATAALQRLQSFDALWRELMTTRRVRGVQAGRHAVAARAREAVVVTGGLLVGALGQASSLALAMDARGFAEARRRTWAGPAPWRAADTVAVGAGLLVVVAAVAARLLLG
ncbi:ATP-binding cassette domain-containing protein [Terrabacter aeriphilus]|uniref:ATP-binding cassette domain-containing protein n=1 Tax=Terrabacter aeriphilus TaxID=515662 RepID=UPI0031EA69BF